MLRPDCSVNATFVVRPAEQWLMVITRSQHMASVAGCHSQANWTYRENVYADKVHDLATGRAGVGIVGPRRWRWREEDGALVVVCVRL